MEVLATAMWLLTMALGGYMAVRSVTASKTPSGAAASVLPTPIVLAHATFAIGFFAVWWYVIARGLDGWLWAVVGGLVLVAAGGLTLFARWLKMRTAHETYDRARSYSEDQIPVAVVAAHGVFAAATVALVVAVAIVS